MSGLASFFERPFPSCNAVLLHGERPVLVDGGFGADLPALEAWLRAQGVPPERLSLVVNTHFDCDHAGANHGLAPQWGLPIAAHRLEAAMVNARHPASCRAWLLRQPVEAYRVAVSLADGDVIETGAARWHVVHTPGHTEGHISLHAPEHGLLVVGDLAHRGDVGWVDATEPAMLDAAEASVARLRALGARQAWSGHGPGIGDPAVALAAAAQRLATWRAEPERMAWHGAKRVFAYGLMVEDGVMKSGLDGYLASSPWFVRYAGLFGETAQGFVAPLLREMLRSGAARWEAGRLVAGAPFTRPPPGWARVGTSPAEWQP